MTTIGFNKSIEQTSYFKEGIITGGGGQYRLAQGLKILNPGKWAGNEKGTIASAYNGIFGPGTASLPIFASDKAIRALESVVTPNESKWQVLIGMIPTKDYNGKISDYDSALKNGNGFYFKYKRGNAPAAEVDKLFFALRAAGFNKIAFGIAGESDDRVLAAIEGTGYYYSAFSNIDPEAHPLYRIHKQEISGKIHLVHYEDMINLPISSPRYFTTSKAKISLVNPNQIHPMLRVKQSYSDIEYELFGSVGGRNPSPMFAANLGQLNGVVNSIIDGTKDPEEIARMGQPLINYLQFYNIMPSASDPKPIDTMPTKPKDTTGGFGDIGDIANDVNDAANAAQKGVNFITRMTNLGTTIGGMFSATVGALVVKNPQGAITGLSTLGIALPVSVLLALGVGGAFQFRRYLKNRKHQRLARQASRDRQLMRELGLETQDLKKNSSDQELQALIGELERFETKDPGTRRLYDI